MNTNKSIEEENFNNYLNAEYGEIYTVIDDEGNEVRVLKIRHLWDKRPSAKDKKQLPD